LAFAGFYEGAEAILHVFGPGGGARGETFNVRYQAHVGEADERAAVPGLQVEYYLGAGPFVFLNKEGEFAVGDQPRYLFAGYGLRDPLTRIVHVSEAGLEFVADFRGRAFYIEAPPRAYIVDGLECFFRRSAYYDGCGKVLSGHGCMFLYHKATDPK